MSDKKITVKITATPSSYEGLKVRELLQIVSIDARGEGTWVGVEPTGEKPVYAEAARNAEPSMAETVQAFSPGYEMTKLYLKEAIEAVRHSLGQLEKML